MINSFLIKYTFSIKNSSAGEIDHVSPRESIRSNNWVFYTGNATRLKQIQFLASMFSAFCEAKFIEILLFCYKKA